jgi:energy-coupling factor transporter ATP-binding protein EcfA2
MAMQYECKIPRPSGGELKLTIETGQSIVIIGANGSGKTRLGVYIEGRITAQSVQRIAAQKSLNINDKISLVTLERATKLLRFGYADGDEQHKSGHRWGSNPATHLLTDFEGLLQTLFAEHIPA